MARLGEFRRVIARARAIAQAAGDAALGPEHVLLAWGDQACPDRVLAGRLRAVAAAYAATGSRRSRVPTAPELSIRLEQHLTAPDFGIRSFLRGLLEDGLLDAFLRVHAVDRAAITAAVAAHGE